jgi:hypothetical protein
MRKLKSLWQALEQFPGLCNILVYWQEACAGDFPLILPHLQLTNDLGAIYPCPNAGDADCPRNIIDYGDGTYAATCRHPLRLCGDIPLSTSDVVVRQLGLAGLLRKCLELLGIRPQELRNSAAGVWELGLSISPATRGQPTYLLVFSNGSAFRAACRDLFFANASPFVVVAPTSVHVTVELLLELTGTTEIAPTPVGQRSAAVAAYQRDYGSTIKAICERAAVDPSDFYKWKKGLLKDSSDKARRIEEALRVPPPHRV